MRFADIQAFDEGGPVDDTAPMRFDDIQPLNDEDLQYLPPNPTQADITHLRQLQAEGDFTTEGAPTNGQGENRPWVTAHQPGPIGAAIAGAAPAAAPITAAIAAGARTMAAIPNPWIGIPAGIVTGLVASGVVGKIQDWLRDKYGPSTGLLSKPYEAAAEEQQPLAYNIGRAAPIAVGMTTGNVTPLVRAASAGLLGGVDVLQQGIEKGFSNINPTEALTQAAAGAILPRAREWAGGARPGAATQKPVLGEEGATQAGNASGAIVPKTNIGEGLDNTGKALGSGEREIIQAQGQQSEAGGVTSSAKGTAEQKPTVPGANIQHEGAAAPDPRWTTEFQGEGSERDLSKTPVQGQAKIPGAPSTVVDTDPIAKDVAAARSPEQIPEQTTAPVPPTGVPAPGAATNPGAQAPAPAARSLPSNLASMPKQPPIAPNARAPIPTERPTPAQEESQIRPVTGHPDIDEAVKMASADALKRPVVTDGPMPSIANSSKDITGPVVVDRQVAQDHPEYIPPLMVHETVEDHLTALGMDDTLAHRIATGAERAEAERRGINWDEYSQYFKDVSPQIEAQKVMPDAWNKYNLHEDPYTAIGHHTNKDILDEFKASEATPPGGIEPATEQVSTPGAEIAPPSGKVEDLNEIPDFLRRLPPRPASLGAAATPGDKALYTSHLLDSWKNFKQNPLWFENPIRKIFSPQSVSVNAEEAAAASRQAHGQRMQADAQNAAGLVDAQRVINSIPAKDVTDYLLNFEKDSVPKGNLLSPIQADVKRVLDSEKARIEQLPEGDTVNFIDNYFPRSGLWDPEEDNMNTLRNFLTSQGSTTALKERKFPTIVDALNAGVKFNPDMLRPDGAPDMMKVLGKYLNQTGTYIESQNMLKDYIDRGVAHLYDITKEGDRIPPGEVRLEGRTYRGLPVYAPEDVATIYNNFWSPGVHGSSGYGDLYDSWMHGKNMMSALTLLGGGYHLSAIATESMLMNASTGIEKMAAGDIAGGLKSIGKSPAAPYTAYKAGKQGLENYLNPKAHPEITPYVGALTDAGFTFAPHQALLENPEFQYMNSPGNNFFSAFKRGSLAMETQAAKQRVQEALSANAIKGIGQVGKEAFNLAGQAIQTAMFPLFQHYIPLVKNGVALEKMAAWADANPGASYEDMVGAARKISDQTDNALGMVHQSNVFWNKVLKQSAQASMLSWGWNFGTVRALGGGALKALRSPSSISPTARDYDPRVSYVIAMPVLTTAMAAIYQLFKTGQMPQEPPNSLGEAFTAATGGKAGGSNEPERAILPGYQKDVLGAWNNIFNPQGTGKVSTEVYNKLAPAVRLGVETLTNEDWASHPIWNPNHPMTQKIKEYFQHVGQSLMPIAGQQLTQAQAGTKIGPTERLLGVRPAPSFVQKPISTGEFLRGKNERDWASKVKLDKRLGR